jgi:hypothetical protein
MHKRLIMLNASCDSSTVPRRASTGSLQLGRVRFRGHHDTARNPR